MVRIALAGVGLMGRTHLRAYRAIPEARITALCDNEADLSRPAAVFAQAGWPAAELGRAGEVRVFRDIDSLLAAGCADAVDVCLPSDLHREATVRALRAGCHVMCEKPMALDVASTRAMIEAARESSRLLSVGQCLRFWPAYVEIKRLIDERRYGRVLTAFFERCSGPPTWGRNWFADPRRSGGALLDLHIHDVDMVLHLFGLPRSVVSTGLGPGGAKHVATTYRYDDKVVGAAAGWTASSSHGFNMRAFLTLEAATVSLDFAREDKLVVFPEGGERFVPRLASGDGYEHELRDFVLGIEAGRLSGIVTPESAARSVFVCLEERRSIAEGREIALD